MFNDPTARNLNQVPAHSEYHHWADYVELLCMTDQDGTFSAERLAAVADFADDLLATSPAAQDIESGDIEESLVEVAQESATQPDSDDEHEDIGENDDPAIELDAFDYPDFGRSAEEADDRYIWCQRIFAMLISRARSLGDAYPFRVDFSLQQIERLDLTESRKAYVFYLCCSSLSYVSKSTMQGLTSTYELVSSEVFRRILPPSAEVDVYGTARGKGSSRFTGSQFERLTQLATVLAGKVLADPDDFHPRDRGDNGLDLVGWIPMPDQAKGVPAFFAQCACGRGWEGKQYEASHERWREFIHLTSPSTKLTFVPHYYRKVGEQWYTDGEVSGIVVDRLRALRVCPTIPAGTPADELVERAWRFSADPL